MLYVDLYLMRLMALSELRLMFAAVLIITLLICQRGTDSLCGIFRKERQASKFLIECLRYL